MVAALEAQLTEQPDNADGWARLLRSYDVMGDAAGKARVLKEMQAHYRDRPQVAADIVQKSKGAVGADHAAGRIVFRSHRRLQHDRGIGDRGAIFVDQLTGNIVGGRPVVAAAPGRVEKLFFSAGGGGNTVYVRSDDGRWMYYYAHLSAYAPGLHEGQRVLRGAPIGFVGATGNANPAGPHLHFAINRMEPGEKWYQGTAINPFPLLAAKPASR